MKAAKLLVLWGLGLVVWAAPVVVDSGLTKRSDATKLILSDSFLGVAAVIMPRSQEADEDVIYTDYKRTTQPEDDEDVIYTDYKRTTQPEDDEDVIYTDYKRTTQPETEDDEDVIYTDY
ncbi:hypothetical protein BCIN_15g04010 [Botrytis cinerea B05.10]|uniref:Uncharacterized protein n=1 Tax=Botryotinia fuckeliana (strain B05.10) TaxID=332648 RepID=A0A384K544_BOTFB|nr:hypothetical protein BCIN_15g04010 [Botrytis cinerea B05.10]ATZ57881.1 hypothetical protein BCIN_15g04010 [Botrytis cinerea B05.10]